MTRPTDPVMRGSDVAAARSRAAHAARCTAAGAAFSASTSAVVPTSPDDVVTVVPAYGSAWPDSFASSSITSRRTACSAGVSVIDGCAKTSRTSGGLTIPTDASAVLPAVAATTRTPTHTLTRTADRATSARVNAAPAFLNEPGLTDSELDRRGERARMRTALDPRRRKTSSRWSDDPTHVAACPRTSAVAVVAPPESRTATLALLKTAEQSDNRPVCISHDNAEGQQCERVRRGGGARAQKRPPGKTPSMGSHISRTRESSHVGGADRQRDAGQARLADGSMPIGRRKRFRLPIADDSAANSELPALQIPGAECLH